VIEVISSEPINPITVQSRTDSFYLYLPALNQYSDATVVVAPDRRSATLTPNEPLLPYAQYYYYVYAFADVAGNVNCYGGVYFYTGAGPDTTSPQVASVNPANGMTGAPVNSLV